MRVLHFTTWHVRCGIAGYAESLIDALDAQGVESLVHAVDLERLRDGRADPIDEDLDRLIAEARDVDVVHIQHEFSFFDRYSLHASNRRFARVLRALGGRPVVVTFHTHPPFRDALLALIARGSGGLSWPAKFLLNARNRWLQWQWRTQVGAQFEASGARALVHTRCTRHALIAESGFEPASVRVIPMGTVARAPSGVSRVEARRRHGLPEDGVISVIFGFVQAFKGGDVAVRALARLPRHFHLVFAGGPHPEASVDVPADIMQLAASLGVADRVRITGYVDIPTLDDYHAASDICLTPYVFGALYSGSAGTTWALSSGRPLIASDIPVFKELAEDFDCVLLCAEWSDEDLAAKMMRLASDQELQARLVARASTAVRYWPDVSREVLESYQQALSRHAPA